MKEHPFQSWVEKTAKYSGVLACGVRLANQSIAIKTFDESFPEARLKELLQCVAEVAFTLRNSQLGSSRLRWVFEHGQLHSARRQDGALAVLAMSKDPNAASAIEELFADFLATVCPAPEKPGSSLPEATEPGAAPDSCGVQ
jgi:hypothetical protein